jgi:hypothetical protein
MSSAEILDPPMLPEPSPNDQKLERERRAFQKLMPGLLAEHEGKYAAVHGEQVVEIGADRFDVAMSAYKRFGYVPIYVTLISREPLRVIRVPSPRLVK